MLLLVASHLPNNCKIAPILEGLSLFKLFSLINPHFPALLFVYRTQLPVAESNQILLKQEVFACIQMVSASVRVHL